MQASTSSFGISIFWGIGLIAIGLFSIIRGKIAVGLGRGRLFTITLSGLSAYIVGISSLIGGGIALFIPLQTLTIDAPTSDGLLNSTAIGGMFVAIIGFAFALIVHLAIQLGENVAAKRKKK